MNTGAFGEGFPYSNFHDLNMDWIIKIAKDFLDQYTHIQDIIDQGKTDIQDLTEQGLTQLQDKADTLEGLLQAWYNEHSQDIADQLADALADLNTWYTTHENYLDQTLATNITLFDQHANQKAAEAIASIPSDYTELANEVRDVKTDIEDITNPGLNMLNPKTVTLGKYINASGVETDRSAFGHSDYIPVTPSTLVYGSQSVGSQTYPTIVQFDSNKDVIADSAEFFSPAGPFSFTTKPTAKYIVFNYNANTYSASELSISYITSTFYPYNLTGSGNTSTLNLFANDIIRYDGGYLRCKTNMYVQTYIKRINLGTSVNVGSGKFLFFNTDTDTLYASNSPDMAKNVYFIGILNTKPEGFYSLMNRTFVIEYDAINNSVYIPQSGTGYLYIDGTFFTPSGDPITLTSEAEHFLVYYSMDDNTFHLTTSYNALKNSDIIIMEAFAGMYNAICPVKCINSNLAQSAARLVTFGDSLTWYDGHEFTWGDHQGETCIGFQSYLTKYLNMQLDHNYGSSGKTTPQICDIIIDNLSNIVDNTIVTIMGGNNDDRLGVPLGTIQPVGGSFNTNTVAGALQDAIERLLRNRPKTRIVIMTEPMGWTYTDNTMKRVSELIPNVYRNVAKLYGLPIIDLWNESGINELTRATYYADPTPPDNTQYMYHPNNDGWKRLSKIICNEIMKM